MTDELVVVETLRPEVVFAPGGVEALLDKLERDVRAVATDISTKAGRAAISSLAHKVSRSKTALDDLGKGLVADWKLRSALVDAERRRIRERLDELRDEVRRPLTEWEDAEKSRIDCHEIALSGIQILVQFSVAEPSSEEIKRRIDELEVMPPREWHEFAKRANEMIAQVKLSLKNSWSAAITRETERAELARLRAEAVERERQERDDRLRAEAAEKARAAAEAEAREAARMLAAWEAEERARVDREKLAAEEAWMAAAAAAEKARADAKAAAEKAERDRIAAEEKAKRDAEAAVETERSRVAYEKEQADRETAKREADEKHRAEINGKVGGALMAAGLSKTMAKIAVEAIASGSVPHVRITY